MAATAAQTMPVERPHISHDARGLEKDASPVADLTIECGACDPDNPRAVPRIACKRCGGTGRERPSVSVVVGEIHASRLELLVGGKKSRRGE